MRLDRLEDTVLVLVGQGRQGIGQGGSDLASCQRILNLDREPSGHLETALGPFLLVSQEMSRRANRQPVIVDERLDHAGFIKGGDGPDGCVDFEHKTLVILGIDRGLDDGRHKLVPCIAPSIEPLEAIEDLEEAAIDRNDPQGEIAHLGRPPGSGSRPKVSITRANPVPGDAANAGRARVDTPHFRCGPVVRCWARISQGDLRHRSPPVERSPESPPVVDPARPANPRGPGPGRVPGIRPPSAGSGPSRSRGQP